MLTPEQLDHYPDALVELWARTEQSIIADMARRINGFDLFIPSAQWQLAKVKEMGQVEEYILQELAAQSYRSWDDLKALMIEAGMKTLEFDDHIYERAGLRPAALKNSPALQAVLLAGLDKTNGLFRNLTNSAAAAGSRQFERALDLSYMQVTTGAFSHTEAIKNAIKQLSRGGLEVVVYDSGRVEHLDVAVRRAVLTGVNQTAAQLQIARADEIGCDLVEPDQAMPSGKAGSIAAAAKVSSTRISSTPPATAQALGFAAGTVATASFHTSRVLAAQPTPQKNWSNLTPRITSTTAYA